jgi:hypothetical protein
MDKRGAGRRCTNTTAMPFEQRRAEALFHQPDSFACRCQSHPSPRGSVCDISGLDHVPEEAQIDQIKAHRRFHAKLAASGLPKPS